MTMAEAEMTRYSSKSDHIVITGEYDSLLKGRRNTDSIIHDEMMKLKANVIASKVKSIKEGFSQSVQHMKVLLQPDGRYKFGQSTFSTVDTFKKHFEIEKPVIGGETGVTVTLKYPYSREIDEKHLYSEVIHHAVTNMIDPNAISDSDPETDEDSSLSDTLKNNLPFTTPITSREGYMTKLGRIRKSSKPLGIIDMLKATDVDYELAINKDHCFRIITAKRTYYIYANSADDCEQWVELLRSKVVSLRPTRTTNIHEDYC